MQATAAEKSPLLPSREKDRMRGDCSRARPAANLLRVQQILKRRPGFRQIRLHGKSGTVIEYGLVLPAYGLKDVCPRIQKNGSAGCNESAFSMRGSPSDDRPSLNRAHALPFIAP